MRFTSVLLGFAALAAAEWPRDIFKRTGKPAGELYEYDGVAMYISKPKGSFKSDTAVVYLTDIYGLSLLDNKRLVDSFANAGYLTIAPDILNGDPADPTVPFTQFDGAAYLRKYNPKTTDPVIEKTFRFIRRKLGIDTIATTGYCYGGKYAIRFLGKGKGAAVGFSAHPTMLQNDEIMGIQGPASFAMAEVDEMVNATRRSEIEGLLSKTKQPFQANLYSGTHHGFGVRIDASNHEQLFGKEEAFFQAVRWFDVWRHGK